jgi:hypothetical protein
MSLRASISPDRTMAYAGIPVFATVTVANTADLVDAFEIRVLGVDRSWVQCSPDRLQLFPQTTGEIDVTIDLPDDFPAGLRTLTIQIRSELKPDRPTLLTLTLEVDSRPRINVQVQPVMISAGSRATFGVTVQNQGNNPVVARLVVDDPESVVTGVFDRPEIDIPPGEQRNTPFRVSAKRPWAGAPAIRTLSIGVEGGLEGSEQMITFVQTPRVSRMLFSFVGLLIAASIFGIVFSRNLKNVVDATTTDSKILEQAFGDADPSEGVEPGTITGTVVARTSKSGIAGATVEIYLSEIPDQPIRSVATSDDGTFIIDNLGPGPFRVRALAAGFDSRWYGDVSAFENSPDLKIDPGITKQAIDLLLGGQPATLKGIVVGGNVEGASVDLIVPASVTGGTQDAVLGNVVVDDTGVFEFQSIPAPGSYDLRVRKVGSITTKLSFELTGGETRTGVTVQLRTGDGSLSGLVNSPDGPLGAATITITSPDQTASTLSLTTGIVGSFLIPDLLTPSSYAVTITSPGFAAKNLTVSLSSGQKITDLNVLLSPSFGSISGLVRDSRGIALGGVPITASDGETTLTTTSVTVDDPATPNSNEIGSFSIIGVPAPGVFTVTIGGGNYSTVVRNVVLRSTSLNESLIVDLTASTGTISGAVRDGSGPVGGVTVRIANGTTSRTTTSASSCIAPNTTCVGTYRLDNIPTGAYTITFSRVGSVTASRQVVVTAGSTQIANQILSIRSTIKVFVCRSNGTTTPETCANQTGTIDPRSGYQVRIWKESDYPGGPILGVGLTGTDGSFLFSSLDAPARYVIEATNVPGNPALTSQTVELPASTSALAGLVVP